jgi:hypothetical protein
VVQSHEALGGRGPRPLEHHRRSHLRGPLGKDVKEQEYRSLPIHLLAPTHAQRPAGKTMWKSPGGGSYLWNGTE